MRRRPTRFAALLLAIAAVALTVRVGYVAFEKWNDPVVGDQIFYNAEANRLAQGVGFVVPFDPHDPRRAGTEPAADHPPLTVVTLLPTSWLVANLPFLDSEALKGGANEQRLTMAVLGTFAVVLVGLLGRAVAGDRAGLVAAGIAAVYPNLWVNDGLVMSETLCVLTTVLALLLAYRFARAPSALGALGLGAACGLAALARAELLLLVPLLAVPVVLLARGEDSAERVQQLVVVVAGALLLVGPWVVFNIGRFQDPTFLSTNDGSALLGANCDDVYNGNRIGLWRVTCLTDVRGDQSVVSTEWKSRAFRYMRDHADRVPAVMLARVGRLWGVFRPRDMLFYNVGEGREPWVTRAGMWTFYPLVALALVGAIVLRRALDLLWPLLVPIVVVTLVGAATYGQTRFRVPAEPSLVVLAAVAIDAFLPDSIRRPARRAPTAEAAPQR